MNTAVLPYIRRKGVSKQGYHPEIHADLANEEQKPPLTGVGTNFMFGFVFQPGHVWVSQTSRTWK